MGVKRGIFSQNMTTMYISGFLYGIAGSMWTPFWVLYIRSLGATLTQVGLVLSLRRVLGMMMDLTGGLISDRSGRKRLIVLSGYIGPLGLALYILANSWEQLLIGVILASFDSLRGTSLQALQAESVDVQHRAQAFAGFQTAVNIPGIIVPIIAGSIIEAEGVLVGEKIAITITIICALIANTTRAVFLQETLGSSDIAGRKESMIEHFRETAASVFQKRSIRVIMVSRAIAHFGLDALNPLLVVYCIENIGVTETEYGVIIGISLLAMIISRLPAARFSDLHGWRTSMLIAAFLYPIFPIAYFLAPSFYWLVLAAVIEPVANSFNFPARNAYIADIVPADKRAGTFSVMFAVITLTAIPGTIFGALLWETYGPPATFALCMGLFMISGLILAAYLEEEN